MGVYVFTNQRMRTPGADNLTTKKHDCSVTCSVNVMLLVPNIWDITAFLFLCFATEWL